MDTMNLGDMIVSHKWVAVSAIVISATVRLLKSDTKLPIDVPPRARIWVVLGLGVVSGALEAVAAGKAWTPAIIDGLVSAFLAVLGHETIIASLRAGKELPVPGLMIEGARPSPGAPVTVPPPPVDAKLTPVVVYEPPPEEPRS